MKPSKYRLKDHPWTALIVVMITLVVLLIAASIVLFEILKLNPEARINQALPATLANLTLIFLVVPFLYRLPKGKVPLNRYIRDIGLSRLQPFSSLFLLGLSCYLIFFLSQAFGTILFRLSEGGSVDNQFIGSMFRLSNEFPPRSNGWLYALPSILEEFVFRGIVLTTFLNKYSSKKAIAFSALGFGLIHLLNLASDRDPLWVFGQVGWGFIMGLFYGYLFVRTGSLLPVVLVHYLTNLFIGTVTGYVNAEATVEFQVLYNIVFFLGVIPVALSILWIRHFLKKWPIRS
jgi:membrane protease YdiL (CAAX protease family)